MDSPHDAQPPHYVGTIFGNQDIRIDGVQFTACVFGAGCRLQFFGEALPVFVDCDLQEGTEFAFAGKAELVAKFFSLLVHRCGDGGLDSFHKFCHDLYAGLYEPDRSS